MCDKLAYMYSPVVFEHGLLLGRLGIGCSSGFVSPICLQFPDILVHNH